MLTRETNPSPPDESPNPEQVIPVQVGDHLQLINSLRCRLEQTVRSLCKVPAHLKATLQVLTRPGFALHPQAPWRTGLLCLESYRAVGGTLTDTALDAAVAVELRMEAGHLFDRVGDEQIDSAGDLTSAEELTVAIALMSCSSVVASVAAGEMDSSRRRADCMLEFHTGTISSCGGQFLDATLEKRRSATLNEALEMTWLKSGSLGRSSASFGAFIAGARHDVAAAFGEVGFNLFTYAQLVDDTRDARPDPDPASDVSRNKKTVPLVSIAENTVAEDGKMEPARAFDESKAQACGAVLAETFLNRARRALEDLEARNYRVAALERFIDNVENRPQGSGSEP